MDVSCLHQKMQVKKKIVSLKILGRMPPGNLFLEEECDFCVEKNRL